MFYCFSFYSKIDRHFNFEIHDLKHMQGNEIQTIAAEIKNWCAILKNFYNENPFNFLFNALTNNFFNCLAIYFDISSLFLYFYPASSPSKIDFQSIRLSIIIIIIDVRKDLNLHAFAITIGISQSILIFFKEIFLLFLTMPDSLWRNKKLCKFELHDE